MIEIKQNMRYLNEEEVKINIDVQSLDAIKLKGFTQPVPIFEVESYKRESP